MRGAKTFPKSLLLADRLFGTGSTVAWVQEACLKAKGSHFLVRVRRKPVRISFRKVRDLSDALWVVTAAAEGLLSPDQLRILVERTMKMIASEALLPPRRSRSCPRAVRQPIGSWPRLVETDSAEGALSFEIITARV